MKIIPIRRWLHFNVLVLLIELNSYAVVSNLESVACALPSRISVNAGERITKRFQLMFSMISKAFLFADIENTYQVSETTLQKLFMECMREFPNCVLNSDVKGSHSFCVEF